MKYTLKEAMAYLNTNLYASMDQMNDREFRADVSPTRDISVFCISPYSDSDDNTTWRYVVQILSKNNTIVLQQQFDKVTEAVSFANKEYEKEVARLG